MIIQLAGANSLPVHFLAKAKTEKASIINNNQHHD
jgi:hypothetical protein